MPDVAVTEEPVVGEPGPVVGVLGPVGPVVELLCEGSDVIAVLLDDPGGLEVGVK